MPTVDLNRIPQAVAELHNIKQQQAAFLQVLEDTAQDPVAQEQFLQGKTKEDHLDVYNKYTLDLLEEIEDTLDELHDELEGIPEAPTQTDEAPVPVPLPTKTVYQSKAKRSKYLKDIGVSEEVLKRLSKPEKIKKLTQIDYTIYKPNFYGKLANTFCRPMTLSLLRKHPDFFSRVNQSLRMSDIKVLSKTYISMMLFSAFFALLIGFAISLPVSFFLVDLTVAIPTSIAIACLLSAMTFVLFYLYPSLVVSNRSRMIKNDLPFAIIHMAAIAGSGAQPISMFKLLLNAGEYPGLESEIKKIVNYVNLFGYDLSTALKTVANSTPSKRFKDVLNGIAATIESGGSLKSYLNSMADDTMNTYKLERKKYVESLSTYSDIYTGILIAAPLLFVVTLAIINLLGGTIGGIGVGTLAIVGTYIVIPVLNIGFILFLNIIQPD